MNSQLLFQANPDPLFAIDFNGRFLVANPACSRLSGYSLPELLGMSFQSLCATDELQRTMTSFTKALQAHTSGEIETAVITKSGQRVELWIAGQFVTLVGNTPAFSCAARDITQRTRAERALVQSEQRLKLALESGGMGYWELEMATGRATWSAGFTALLGLRPGVPALSQESFREVIYPEDRVHHDAELLASLEQRREHHCEFRVVWPNGEVHWVEARGRYHYNVSGAPVRMCGVLIDIDERKQAEAALHESESRFRIMADGAPIIIWVTDAEGRLLFVNEAYRNYFDVSLEAALRNGWKCLVHPENGDYVDVFTQALQARSTFRAETRVLSHGSWRWVQSDARPRLSPSGEFLGMVGSSFDITERKRFQAELEDQVQQRTRSLSELIGQLNDFCYSIAHDLKAPLRAQLAYATILLTEHRDTLTPDALHCAERIEHSARRQSVLVADLLKYMSLSREDLPLEAVDLEQTVRTVLFDFEHEIHARNASVEVKVSGCVRAVPDSLRLVLSNLVDNALKFVPPERSPSLRVCSKGMSDGVRLWVSDNGLGIPPGCEQKLFSLFQRLHNSAHFPGTGVGLATVKKAVERMGGEVGYEPRPTGGSSFWIQLPAA